MRERAFIGPCFVDAAQGVVNENQGRQPRGYLILRGVGMKVRAHCVGRSMDADRHRAFVREIDRSFGQTYGFGGLGVLVSVSVWGYAVFELGWYTRVWAYGIGLTLALVALRVVSEVVRRKRPQLLKRVVSYCEANEVSVEQLRSYFESEQVYPYFLALFESRPGSELKR